MSTTPITSLTGTSSTGSTSALGSSNSLKSGDFIQMMLTELQNQDPLNPTDSQALLSQMSSIGQLQSADQLQTTLTQFSMQNQISSAGNLIGKTIQGLDSSSKQTVGIVTGVAVQNNQVWLTLSNNDAVQMNNVEQIVNTPTSTATPGTPITTAPTPAPVAAPTPSQTNQAAAAALVQRMLGGAA